MAHDPQLLDMARRHVAEAQLRIARQAVLLARLRAEGQPTGLASDLLASMTETARHMRAHYDLLRQDQDAG